MRYRKHYGLPGKPDFALVRASIAIFCDGDFWHGNNWRIRGLGSQEDELARYDEAWAKKIRRNIERDKSITRTLEDSGWLVLRFWESDIRKSADTCAIVVRNAHDSRVNATRYL